MNDTFPAYRVGLAACAAFVTWGAVAAPGANAAASSTWYWQNPLPRAYSMQAISCPSIKECVTVGQGGSITTTTDGGRHWMSRRSGTSGDLLLVSCPSRAVCYAVGSTQGNFQMIDVLLKSVDGGVTWFAPAADVSLGGVEWGGPALTCPSTTTCLLSAVARGSFQILRTADGGKTWQPARGNVDQGTGPIVCPTTTICYAGQHHVVYRSTDAGATWTSWSTVPGNRSGFIGALACPRAGSCIVVLGVCLDCGDDAVHMQSGTDAQSEAWVDLFLTRDDGKTWRHVVRGGRGDATALVCGSAMRCYALGSPDVFQTGDAGKTWVSYPLPFANVGTEVTCPGAKTCYAAADYTVLKTTDGFHHIRQTPARSSIAGNMLATINCPTKTTCYANSFLSRSAATADGGKSWSLRQGRPMNYLSCPGRVTCYGASLPYPGNGRPPAAMLFRTTDGARSWRRLPIPVHAYTGPGGLPGLGGFACVGERTCYLLLTASINGRAGLALLVTTNGGAAWRAQRSMNTATARGNLSGGGLSCPGASTCFVALGHGSGVPGSKTTITVLETKDAGGTWMQPSRVPCGPACNSVGFALACPAITTCYVAQGGHVAATHDTGATWHSATVSKGGSFTAIGCAGAQSCRVAGISGIYGTSDGGASWHKEMMEGNQPFPQGLSSIACPAVDTCYAVGQEDILATHPSR